MSNVIYLSREDIKARRKEQARAALDKKKQELLERTPPEIAQKLMDAIFGQAQANTKE